MRPVDQARQQDPDLSLNAAVKRIGSPVWVNADTLRGWVKQSDITWGAARGPRRAMLLG